MVFYEKRGRFIGQMISHNGKYGEIIGIYPDFLLVKGENYNFTINYRDMRILKDGR